MDKKKYNFKNEEVFEVDINDFFEMLANLDDWIFRDYRGIKKKIKNNKFKIEDIRKDPNTKKINVKNIWEVTLTEKKPPNFLKFYVDYLQRGYVTIDYKADITFTLEKINSKTKIIIKEYAKKLNDKDGIMARVGGNGVAILKWIRKSIPLQIHAKAIKELQIIIKEKSIDDITVGHYKLLEEKLKESNRKIEDLNNKIYEVRLPVTFSNPIKCSECKAPLEITKGEEVVICQHCGYSYIIKWE